MLDMACYNSVWLLDGPQNVAVLVARKMKKLAGVNVKAVVNILRYYNKNPWFWDQTTISHEGFLGQDSMNLKTEWNPSAKTTE